MIDNDNDYEMR